MVSRGQVIRVCYCQDNSSRCRKGGGFVGRRGCVSMRGCVAMRVYISIERVCCYERVCQC